MQIIRGPYDVVHLTGPLDEFDHTSWSRWNQRILVDTKSKNKDFLLFDKLSTNNIGGKTLWIKSAINEITITYENESCQIFQIHKKWSTSLPTLTIWNPSTSFSGTTTLQIFLSSMWGGKGSWTKIPSTSGSWLNLLMAWHKSPSDIDSSKWTVSLDIPRIWFKKIVKHNK